MYTRGEDLRPVARLSTQTTTRRLYGSGGEQLADFADDRVRAETLAPAPTEQHWREWEIELVHAAGRFFAATARLFDKSAKRLRHAAETVTGIHGKSVRNLVKAAKRLQQIHGDHQDSAIARNLLTRLAAGPDRPRTQLAPAPGCWRSKNASPATRRRT